MVLATLIGAPLGAVVGLALGGLAASRLISIKLDPAIARLDVSADDKEDVELLENTGKPVGFRERALLKHASLWLDNPDHHRVEFISSILKLLWPVLSPAVYKEVMVQAKQPLEDACKLTKGLVTAITITKLDLGTIPPRLDSFRITYSESDEIIIEAPLFWGSDMRVGVAAVAKAGKYGLVEIPLEVANIQVKAMARVTVKPLVEKLPCVGGIVFSLMEAPHVDLDVHLAGSADLLALPLVPEAVKLAIKIMAGQMLVYPNEISVPIMENYGVPPPPQGMLHVTVVKGTGLKSSWFDKVDPFVMVEVREGKGLQTTTIDNDTNPVWNETLVFVVDDPRKQTIRIKVMDEDIMASDLVGIAEIPLKGAGFITRPGVVSKVTVPVREPPPQDDATEHPEAAPDIGEVVHDLEGKNPSDAEAAGAVVGVEPGSEASTPRESGVGGGSETETPERKEKRMSKFLRKLKLKKDKSGHDDTSSGNVKPLDGTPGSSGKKEGRHRNKAKDAPGEVTGHITFEFKYTPFGGHAPLSDGPGEPERVDSKTMRRTTTMKPQARDRGLLSLDLKRCVALEEEADTYVLLTLNDPTRGSRPDTTYKTPMVLEEQSPQYRFQMDFVNVSAISTLTLMVMQRPTLLSTTASKIPFMGKAKSKKLGYVQIKASDIVVEDRVSGRWALQEAQTGEMEMTVQWLPIDVDDFGDV